ncbi:hypothetical protein MIR68_010104 [Amoeboaphelidium protococcarum]|nr:hypothetical protein MIR68_010104 [Amoeboaphelidium protococcarum]
MWERFEFEITYHIPTFDDFMIAAGFNGNQAWCKKIKYFRQRQEGTVEKDEIKESLSKDDWLVLIDLSSHVKQLDYGPLVENDDESLRLVLEHDFYEHHARFYKNIIHKLYGPEKKVNIIDVSGDSFESSIQSELKY